MNLDDKALHFSLENQLALHLMSAALFQAIQLCNEDCSRANPDFNSNNTP